MKGIILAGGLGSRLRPLTKVTNKHLLQIYAKPMIDYPIETLVEAGIKDIMVLTGGNSAGDFPRLLGNGKDSGLDDIYQESEGGIADALTLGEHFAEGERVCVILGENIIQNSTGQFERLYQATTLVANKRMNQRSDPRRSHAGRSRGYRSRSLRYERVPMT